jgi:hypothetical protein
VHYGWVGAGRALTFDGYIDVPGIAHLTGEQLVGNMWFCQVIERTSDTATIPPGIFNRPGI